MEEILGTKGEMVLGGVGNEEERLSGGVGLDEYGVEFPRNPGRIPLLLPLEAAAWSMDKCDIVVDGDEWKDECVSAGVVAVIGDRLFAMVECMLCWKKGPGFSAPGVLCPPPPPPPPY